MDSMFVWILIFAGATISLLGVFLIASERELKKKRVEVEQLLAKLGEASAPGEAPAAREAPPVDLTEPAAHKEVSRLMALNEELQNQINNQAAKLELARRAIDELEKAQQEAGAFQDLSAANQRMTAEISDLKEQLRASAARATQCAAENEQLASEQQGLRREISTLNDKLEESRRKIQELQSSDQKLASVEALETAQAQERQELEARIEDLEQNLGAALEKAQERDALRLRLEESERDRQDLAQENKRLAEETARLQSRVAEAEESQRQLTELSSAYDSLRSKQELIAQRSKEFHDYFSAFANLIAEPIKESAGNSGASNVPADPAATLNLSDPSVAAAARASAGAETPVKPKSFFGVLALLAAGALAVLIYTAWDSPRTEPTAATADLNPPATAQSAAQGLAPAVGRAPVRGMVAPPRNAAGPPPDRLEPTKQTGKKHLEPQTAGTYEVTRPSRVYAAPSEFSTLIADIEPGSRFTSSTAATAGSKFAPNMAARRAIYERKPRRASPAPTECFHGQFGRARHQSHAAVSRTSKIYPSVVGISLLRARPDIGKSCDLNNFGLARGLPS